MSLSSLPSPAASGSARSLDLTSGPGTRLAPATPGGATEMEDGGLEVLFDPLSPPETSLLSDAATGSTLPSGLMPSMLTSRLGNRLPRPGLEVLRSCGCSLWFC